MVVGIVLAPKDWEQLRSAMLEGPPVTIPATAEGSFAQSVQ